MPFVTEKQRREIRQWVACQPATSLKRLLQSHVRRLEWLVGNPPVGERGKPPPEEDLLDYQAAREIREVLLRTLRDIDSKKPQDADSQRSLLYVLIEHREETETSTSCGAKGFFGNDTGGGERVIRSTKGLA